MQFADITLRDQTPVATRFDDVYYSLHGGLAETRHVFLHQNNLPNRLPQAPGEWFVIGETGFGTGLNFLTTWQAWRDHRPADRPTGRLHFISTEKYPVHPEQLGALLAPWRAELPVAEALVAQYRFLTPGWNRFSFDDAELTLFIGDALDGLTDCTARVDAWYLDGFAPARNPDLWQPELFAALGRLSHSGTTLATYTAARIAREGLRAAGFAMERCPGFGRKRHMLRGQFVGLHGPLPFDRNHYWWPRPDTRLTPEHSIVVIGSGLAAAETVQRLQDRYFQRLTLISPDAPGTAASGNDQGAVYAKPGLEADPNTQWYAQALSYRLRLWHSRGQHWPGEACGQLQLMAPGRWQAMAEALDEHPFAQLARPVSAADASALAGVPLDQPALWFAASGWLSPQGYCQQNLADVPRVAARATQLTQTDAGHWLITLDTGDTIDADAVVIAAGQHSHIWAQTAWLPLKPVRGQVTATRAKGAPRTVICGKSYVTPANAEGHWHFGASFELNTDHRDISDADTQGNLDALARISPVLGETASGQATTDRAGVRATTPDYLPLAGPAISDALRARDPRRCFAPWSDLYQPNLFVLTGLGSKGLASAPLLAEYLVCQMTGEPLPFGHAREKRIHCGRQWLKQAFRGNQPVS